MSPLQAGQFQERGKKLYLESDLIFAAQGQLVEAFTGTPGVNGAPAEGGGSKEVEKLIKNQLGGLMYNGVGLG